MNGKKRKRLEKIHKKNQEIKSKKDKAKAGNVLGLTGRELFEFEVKGMNVDDEEMDDDELEREDLSDDDDVVEITDGGRDGKGWGDVETPAEKPAEEDVAVDEDLFGEDLEDLDELDDQLGEIAIEEGQRTS